MEPSAPALHSNISVVREILQRVIEPSIAHCSGSATQNSAPYLHTKGTLSPERRRTDPLLIARLLILCIPTGLLLVGPPGVGKTYAVKAAKALCEGSCKVAGIPLTMFSTYIQRVMRSRQ